MSRYLPVSEPIVLDTLWLLRKTPVERPACGAAAVTQFHGNRKPLFIGKTHTHLRIDSSLVMHSPIETAVVIGPAVRLNRNWRSGSILVLHELRGAHARLCEVRVMQQLNEIGRRWERE